MRDITYDFTYTSRETEDGTYNPTRVAYHRNGPAGVGVYVIEFRLDGRALIGIVPEAERPDSSIVVLDRAEPSDNHYNGPWFASCLRSTAAEYSAQLREALCSR